MKATVGRWTAIQNHLPKDDAGNRLWDWIEHRTWGKSGQSKVAIGLNNDQQVMVDAAIAALDEKHGRYVEAQR